MIASTLIRLKMARLIEVFGCKSLEIMTVVITMLHDIENGTGIIAVETDEFTVLLVVLPVTPFVGITMHMPELGVIPGGHCSKQYS
jgi:hypothetical protein